MHLNAKAQDPYIRHYTTLDGLPSNTIYQIYQDSKHFMWLTTDAGVVKFDGSTFINYRKSEGLSSNDVIRVKEDKYGRVWFFCYNATLNFYYSNAIYSHHNSPFLNALLGKGLILDCIDFKEDLLFYNMQCELFILDSNNFVKRNKFFKKALTLPLKWNSRQSVRVSFVDLKENNDLRIWTSYGVFSQSHFKSIPIADDTSIKIESVFPTKNKYYYAKCTNIGLIRINSDLSYERITVPFDFSKIKYVVEDSKGYLWVSAFDGGVYCFRDDKLIKWLDIKDALHLFEDYENNIWVSSQSSGLYLVSHDVLSQKHYNLDYFNKLRIKTLIKANGIGVWSTDGRSLFYYRSGKIVRINVFEDDGIDLFSLVGNDKMFIAKKNKFFYIVKNARLSRPTNQLKLNMGHRYDVSIKKLLYDNNNDIRVLFDQNRVLESSSSDNFDKLEVNYISERITNAFFDSRNNLVINGRKNFIYNKGKIYPSMKFKEFDGCVIVDHERIDHYNEVINVDGEKLYLIHKSKAYDILGESNTAIRSQIRKILVHNNCLYFNTNSNIYMCENLDRLLAGKEVFIQPIGINFQSINDFLIIADSLYIASDYGLTIISETQFKNCTSSPPTPYVASAKINEVLLKFVPNEIKVVGKNRISFTCRCIDFTSNPYYYLYRLEGKDTSWIKARGGDAEIIYQNLPKGTYTFKLKVRKANSDWSDTLEFPIIIMPMFYEYPLFWLLVAILLGIIAVLIGIQIKIYRMKQVENSHQLIVMEQRALLSMMNPHFIFNSLGSIQGFLLKNRTGEAILYLTQFARLIRQNFSAINVTMIYLDEEIERLKNYLELEQVRLENKFDYFIEIDEVLNEDVFFVPSMIIQPFVENSIWHGVAKLDSSIKGNIAVRFKMMPNEMLRVLIEDNGIGISNSMKSNKKSISHLHQSMGMTKRRLKLLSERHNCNAHLVIVEIQPWSVNPGTKVEIYIPITSEKPEKEQNQENS